MQKRLLVAANEADAEAFNSNAQNEYETYTDVKQILQGGDTLVFVLPGAEHRPDFNRIQLAMKATGKSFTEFPKTPKKTQQIPDIASKE